VHAFFQRVDIFLRQGMIEIDVIVEAVVDNRTDRHFRIGPQLFNRVSQQMRTGVANNFQARFIFSGNDGDGGIFGDGIDRIHQLPINASGNTGFRQPRTDVQRNIHHAYRAVIAALAAIRKSNYRHLISLIAVVSHTKAYIQH